MLRPELLLRGDAGSWRYLLPLKTSPAVVDNLQVRQTDNLQVEINFTAASNLLEDQQTELILQHMCFLLAQEKTKKILNDSFAVAHVLVIIFPDRSSRVMQEEQQKLDTGIRLPAYAYTSTDTNSNVYKN